MNRFNAAVLTALSLAALAGLATAQPAAGEWRVAQARTCKQVSSCEEAVRLWCDGYRRADADNDGIPCENVCGSKRQVDAIRAQIGC